MLLTIEFPITDSRHFIPGPPLLPAPSWGTPEADIQSQRFFGRIRHRLAGGAQGWAGEDVICKARRALRLETDFARHDAEQGFNTPVVCALRRFYFDGHAVGKFEFGISSPKYKKRPAITAHLSRNDSLYLLRRFLSLTVQIRPHDAPLDLITCKLAKAGPPLARLYATASLPLKSQSGTPDWAVQAGSPLLFLEARHQDQIEPPFETKPVALPAKWKGVGLSYGYMSYAGEHIPIWILDLSARTDTPEPVRELRLYLMRLHVEHICLRTVLRHIAAKRLVVPRDGELETYLRDTVQRISNFEDIIGMRYEELPEVLNIACSSMQRMHPGLLEALVASLESLRDRPDLSSELIEYIKKWERGSSNLPKEMEVRLTGKERKLLRVALLAAFPGQTGLEVMVREGLDENLNELVAAGDLGGMAFHLIQWAESQGKVQALLTAAHDANPDNAMLKNTIDQILKSRLQAGSEFS